MLYKLSRIKQIKIHGKKLMRKTNKQPPPPPPPKRKKKRKEKKKLFLAKYAWVSPFNISLYHLVVCHTRVLGPVHFVIFINDLIPDTVNSLCQMYADDTKALAEVEKESVAKLRQDLDILVEWADCWQL